MPTPPMTPPPKGVYVMYIPEGYAAVDVPCKGPNDAEPRLCRLRFENGVLMLDSLPRTEPPRRVPTDQPRRPTEQPRRVPRQPIEQARRVPRPPQQTRAKPVQPRQKPVGRTQSMEKLVACLPENLLD